MGTWGTAVFSDDFALDVRDAWRDALIETRDESAAFAAVAETFKDEIGGDPEDASVFWLALAAAQMETGRLRDDVRERAVAIIDRGDDLARWEEIAGRRQRAKVLERLRAKLEGPQPAPKRIRRPRVQDVAFDPGDVVFMRSPTTGRAGLVYVVDRYDSRTPAPVVELLIWNGKNVPSEDELTRLPALQWQPRGNEPKPLFFVVATRSKEDAFGPHLGKVIAQGIKRPKLADWRRGALNAVAPCYTDYNVTWPGLAKTLDGGRRSDS
jgi:hypothetical protein